MLFFLVCHNLTQMKAKKTMLTVNNVYFELLQNEKVMLDFEVVLVIVCPHFCRHGFLLLLM